MIRSRIPIPALIWIKSSKRRVQNLNDCDYFDPKVQDDPDSTGRVDLEWIIRTKCSIKMYFKMSFNVNKMVMFLIVIKKIHCL